MAARECLFAPYIATLTAISGGVEFAEPCAAPATHTVVTRFASDGLTITVEPEVCEEHERLISGARHYVRSIKLRQHAVT